MAPIMNAGVSDSYKAYCNEQYNGIVRDDSIESKQKFIKAKKNILAHPETSAETKAILQKEISRLEGDVTTKLNEKYNPSSDSFVKSIDKEKVGKAVNAGMFGIGLATAVNGNVGDFVAETVADKLYDAHNYIEKSGIPTDCGGFNSSTETDKRPNFLKNFLPTPSDISNNGGFKQRTFIA